MLPTHNTIKRKQMAKAIAKVKTTPNLAAKEPSMYNVIYINDDVTTMEFVIESLLMIFDMQHDVAVDITDSIHSDGSAVVAILPYEMAEQKGVEVTQLARAAGFPLVIKLEPNTK
jgi:ATP-dependent Clp protease adaptor protein ClpS